MATARATMGRQVVFHLGFIPETGRQDLLQLAADAETRLKVMDDEGIDRVALFPTHALRLGGVRHPQLAPALFRAYNNWLAEHCAPNKERLLGVAMIPLQEPELAVQRGAARRRRNLAIAAYLFLRTRWTTVISIIRPMSRFGNWPSNSTFRRWSTSARVFDCRPPARNDLTAIPFSICTRIRWNR